MSSWRLALPVDAKSETPLFLQIARGITAAIKEGRLQPGDLLPSIRALADDLEVNRNTVLAAYQELAAEGLLVSRQGGGSYVADPLPKHVAEQSKMRPIGLTSSPGHALGFALPPSLDGQVLQPQLPKAVLACFTGHSDPRLLPMVALARAYRRAMHLKEATHFVAEAPQGHPKLLRSLQTLLAQSKGLNSTEESILVTSGVKAALDLIARGLLSPGDRVAVEDPGNPALWEVFRRAKAELVPIPVDDQGMVITELQAAQEVAPLRMVFTTPLCQYPTTGVLTPERRQALLSLARAHRMAILEFDQDADFQYAGATNLPLASQDEDGVVVYLGALSKVLFPNLPMAYIHAPTPVINHLIGWRQAVDPSGDPVMERAISELLDDGEIERHLNRLRKTCHERRDILTQALEDELSREVRIRPPASGMSFWIEVLPGINVDTWASFGIKQGVAFRTGRQFTFDQRALPFFRFGFGALDEGELHEAARRLARSCPLKR